MHKKKILVIISGKLFFFKEENAQKLKDSFKNFDLQFCIFPWQGQSKSMIDKFLKVYQPIHFKEIRAHNFENDLKKIKFPDLAGNPIGTLNMYKSITLSFSTIQKLYDKSDTKPDYILRYRSDILPKDSQLFLRNELKNKSILVPDRYHWNGLNDQIYMFRFQDLKIFNKFDNYLKDHIISNRFFSSEYIFFRFIKKYFKINYSNFDYNIMRLKNNFKKTQDIESKKMIADTIHCKLNKFKYKIRNFNDHYIKKINRNKFQDIYIDLDNNAS